MMISPDFKHWLLANGVGSDASMVPIPGDASARKYFRIANSIGMDASLEATSCTPYQAVGEALRAQGLRTPHILAADLGAGYMLLEDFGDKRYLTELTAGNADKLYGGALTALANLQQVPQVVGWPLAEFDSTFILREMGWFCEWYLGAYLQLTLSADERQQWQQTFNLLVANAAAQPRVFVHRDFHAANLMCLANGAVGILDFQDAFMGPMTYDLVSLLRDCYIDWPAVRVRQWVQQFQQQMPAARQVDAAVFMRWFDVMGIQRHLKALMTFSRKYCRDQNDYYLQFMPRTLNYILQTSRTYPEFDFLHQFIKKNILCVA